MDIEFILTDLERIVHELWRARMSQSGWRRGLYSPDSKTHDALVPFDDLGRADRLALALYVRSEGLEESLARLLTYPRGANRPFLKDELREGLKVALCEPGAGLDSSPTPPEWVGAVTGRQLDDSGEVHLIAVRWSDDTVEEYSPWECVLARLDEVETPPQPGPDRR